MRDKLWRGNLGNVPKNPSRGHAKTLSRGAKMKRGKSHSDGQIRKQHASWQPLTKP